MPRTLRVPQTVAYPADNSVKRVFYDRFDCTQPDMNLNDSFNDTYDIGTVGVSRGYTDYHQGRAIHMADSCIH